MRNLHRHLLIGLPFLLVGSLAPMYAGAEDVTLGAMQNDQSISVSTKNQDVDAALSPAWQSGGVKPWKVVDRSSAVTLSPTAGQSLSFDGLGFSSRSGARLSYDTGSGWQAHAGVDQNNWHGVSSVNECYTMNPALREKCNQAGYAPELLGGGIGASYQGNVYGFGVGVKRAHAVTHAGRLPRVVPNAPMLTTVNGVPFYNLDNSTSLEAHGSMRVWDDTFIDVGASVGKVKLLSGSRVGTDQLDQKSLSVGVRKGGLSGHVVGRVMDPQTNVAEGIPGDQEKWSSIDLGVTWELPKEGSTLSFGAQNLWSSGSSSKTFGGSSSDRSRIPFVQYHQDF